MEFDTHTDLLKVAAKSVVKPNFEIGNTPHKFLNHHFNFPNRVEWKPIEVKLVDHIGKGGGGQDSVTSVLYNQFLRAAGYRFPTDEKQCQLAVTKDKASREALQGVTLKQLSGDGPKAAVESCVVEEWTLRNPWVSMINFGDLAYEDDGLVELTLTITYDWAEYKAP